MIEQTVRKPLSVWYVQIIAWLGFGVYATMAVEFAILMKPIYDFIQFQEKRTTADAKLWHLLSLILVYLVLGALIYLINFVLISRRSWLARAHVMFWTIIGFLFWTAIAVVQIWASSRSDSDGSEAILTQIKPWLPSLVFTNIIWRPWIAYWFSTSAAAKRYLPRASEQNEIATIPAQPQRQQLVPVRPTTPAAALPVATLRYSQRLTTLKRDGARA